MAEHGGGTLGHRKHRQGGKGKNAAPPSRHAKQAASRDSNRSLAEKEEIRRRKKSMQDFGKWTELKKKFGRKEP